jgi:hypothetical protein
MARILCKKCGYVLPDAAVGRCPECGAAFDRANEATWTSVQTTPATDRVLSGPPSALEFALCLIGSVVVLYAYLPPGRFEWPSIAGWAIWAAVLMLWTFRVVMRLSMVGAIASEVCGSKRFWIRVLLIPVLFGVTLGVVASDLPLRCGVFMARKGLQRAVRLAPAMPLNLRYEVDAWPYRLEHSYSVMPNTVSFVVKGDETGAELVYAPGAVLPIGSIRCRLTKIAGGWYAWRK